MTFDECVQKNPNKLIRLIEVDILTINTQWINAGAGIWCLNLDGLYSWVDATLLNGFTGFAINDIGSVCIDYTVFLQRVNNLSDLNGLGNFYYDLSSKFLYICLPNYDSPFIHSVKIGPSYGFIDKTFNPINSNSFYDNRIINFPDVSFSRDPMFFGKLSFGDLSFTIANGDGLFDDFADYNSIYGNPARVKVGFEEIDISEYKTIYSAYVTNVSLDEETFTFTISDKRKQLTKPITYSCINKNSLEVIEEILNTNYLIPFNSFFYNTTNWNYVKTLVSNVTINTQELTPIIDIIEMICNSNFGVFIIDSEGKFDFKVIDPTLNVTDFINFEDLLLPISISYDPSEVISSTYIGYNKDWTKNTSSAYTWLSDISNEKYVGDKYNVLIQKTIETILPDFNLASEFSTKILEYNKDVRGRFSNKLPVKYYSLNVGDFVLIEIDRLNKGMLYLRKCEILSKKYNLIEGTITFDFRIMEEQFIRITTDGSIRLLTNNQIRSDN